MSALMRDAEISQQSKCCATTRHFEGALVAEVCWGGYLSQALLEIHPELHSILVHVFFGDFPSF
jgi:hypothetical protein